MKVDINTMNAYSEVYEVLQQLPESDKEKIPREIWNGINNNKNNEYKFPINIYVSMNAWGISKKAKTILAVIFRDYLANEKQRNAIKEIENIQLREIDKQAKQKYNTDKLFENKTEIKIEQNNLENKNMELVEVKEKNLLKRILYKMKEFFKMNKI